MAEMYLRAIKEGIAEYKRLSNQKRSLEVQMQKLLQLVAANVNMLPDAEQEPYIAQLVEMTPPSGLSDAVLRVLKANEAFSPTEVRDRLIEIGYDFAGQANPLASIHTTLKRLLESGDVSADTPQPDGKTYYKRTDKNQGIERLQTLGELLRTPIRPEIAGLNDPLAGLAIPSRRGFGQRPSQRGMEPRTRKGPPPPPTEK